MMNPTWGNGGSVATCGRAGSAQTGQAHDRAGGATLERMQTAELHNLLRAVTTRGECLPRSWRERRRRGLRIRITTDLADGALATGAS